MKGPPVGFRIPSNKENDAVSPILIFVIACLVTANLALASPDAAVLTADQIDLMPLLAP